MDFPFRQHHIAWSEPKSLRNKFLCSRHFDPRFFQHKWLPGSLDEDENIFNTVEDSSLETTEEEEEESSNSSKVSETSNAPADPIDDFSATVESCAVVFLAGYLVKKCLDRYKCCECRDILQNEEDLADDDELLTFYKNYNIKNSSGLKTPSNFMRQFT
ncbi:uncharacterized protein [Leptinotarsa decemlineata]|uniref:uncharacterized protein n=1 Tax=Leptinotarsa decemlineata TaxID=7539 RepID=UPI003D30AE25